jgi:hypothetical protein
MEEQNYEQDFKKNNETENYSSRETELLKDDIRTYPVWAYFAVGIGIIASLVLLIFLFSYATLWHNPQIVHVPCTLPSVQGTLPLPC